jgi:hypothetical protein
MLPGTTLGRLARLNCMPPRASLNAVSTWLRIIGLQVRALPGANQVPEPIQRRFEALKIARKTRSSCQNLATFWANPLQYPLCSVETRRTVEVYLNLSSTALFLAAVSPFLLSKGDPSVDPSGHSRHPGTDFLVLAFGGAADRQNPAGWISRTAGSFFAPHRRIPKRPCRLGYIDCNNITP